MLRKAFSRTLATLDQAYFGNFHALQRSDFLIDRHIGPNNLERDEMLKVVKAKTLDDLIQETLPANLPKNDLPEWPALTETEALARIQQYADKNIIAKNFVGGGYYGTIVPNVILRNLLECPQWYTSYTPYQSEISQGRLESLLNYQTMITQLTGLPIANASLLDESTAAAEAMLMCFTDTNRKKPNFIISDKVFPNTIAVVQTRAEPLGVNVHVVDINSFDFSSSPICGVLVQSPDNLGEIHDFTGLKEKLQGSKIPLVMGTDLLALMHIKSPGEMGVDIAYGNSQRFGVPMGFGGPHAAFFACTQPMLRKSPGRIIGVSKDANGKLAFRMTMQTREQHIRREKASSNICTAQALLANMAAMYGVYHGVDGLSNISSRVYGLTTLLKQNLIDLGYEVETNNHFDTLVVKGDDLFEQLKQSGVNVRNLEGKIGVSLDETHTVEEIQELLGLFASFKNQSKQFDLISQYDQSEISFPQELARSTVPLSHNIFKEIHSETQMLRYLHRLMNKDISLANSMITLGSCTMKLNATAEMIPVTNPKFGNIHPHAPADQTVGYQEMIEELRQRLKHITAFDEISFQPNSGAQGEYAGLLAIRKYHQSRGDARNVCLIPTSAHGTNPASASLAGMDFISVNCDTQGNIDLKDLKNKAQKYKDQLGAIMVTYPSTHGVFEEGIVELTDVVHHFGGQVYMDGANMNAQVGLTAPGAIGADVCHLNLHKTFSIPHGGGGPGMGPIGVKAHLAPFLPGDVITKQGGTGGQVSASHFGSGSILTISWLYIEAMGSRGLTESTKHAILNANYMMNRLKEHYKVVYIGQNGRVAHEFILDMRPFKQTCGVTEEDIAKRLIDYGFHAPTMSFPIPGTLMIEPTESESKMELDLFCEALINIRNEIQEIEMGIADKYNNVLKNAPHSLDSVINKKWDKPYSRQKAAFPLNWVQERGKFWPTVGRVDNVYGDKNPILVAPDFKTWL